MEKNIINKSKNKEKFRFWVWVIIAIAIISGWLGLPQKVQDSIIAMIALGPLLGIITGAMAGMYAEALDKLTGGLLKEEYTLEILGIDISIPVLIIVTFLIELFLFGF